MWGKIKSFMSSRKVFKELADIGKGFVTVIKRNKIKLLSIVLVFTAMDVVIKYLVLNEQVGSGMLIGVLAIIQVLFIPVFIYAMLQKSSFVLVDKDERTSNPIMKFLFKLSPVQMFFRFYKVIFIVLAAWMVAFFGSKFFSAFVPSLFKLDSIENINVWNMFMIAPFGLFFVYVLFVGTAIAIFKALSDNDKFKPTIVFAIRKSVQSFWAILFLTVVYFAVYALIVACVGDYVYVMCFLDYVMLAAVAVVFYVISDDKSKMKL
ncbi:hypothetical protein [Pseudomonas sp. HY7a-MNA-CIBAN-0227]|uniref:hypothetical protein n=1 Tax=Pseudomonas sp. HY7a-MNA-CIBAN-0227 TaxID=3140474 RepID=UPI00331DE24F